MYDLVVIGSGPAGLSAIIYAQRAKLNALVIERDGVSGGQVLTTYEVDNYPALPGISGYDLGTKMREHADKLGAEFVEDEVLEIKTGDGVHTVICENNTYETKGVILATGAKHAELGVPGEEDFAGMGVSYCATCDGAFFKDKNTAVVGGGDVAVEDAIFLARICKEVYLIHRRDELRAAKSLIEAMKNYSNIHCVWNSVVEEIKGNDMVESVSLYNKVTGEKTDLAVSGVFVAVGIRPNSQNFINTVECNEGGYIVAGEDCRTSVKGIYVAGDARSKQLRQIVTAVSDGANAVTSFQQDFIS